jgi:hypothetical protein
VLSLAELGMAAAAADCMSCEIGSAEDAWANGQISVVNGPAKALGIDPGMSVAAAAECLAGAVAPKAWMAAVSEARQSRTLKSGLVVTLVDSASLVGPEDAGTVVLTGSHGGLIGGDPRRALKAPARVAVFNDAGLGPNGVGTTRLPALEAKDIAAVTVSHETARIGDAVSALETGRVSAANRAALHLGAYLGVPLLEWLETMSPKKDEPEPWVERKMAGQ